VKLHEVYSGLKELSVFLKEKVYEVTKDPSYTFEQKVKQMCIFYKKEYLTWHVIGILKNLGKVSYEKIIETYLLAKSLGYEGEMPKLRVTPIMVRPKTVGLFDFDFVVLNKNILFDE
jgi:hypothetical protein